MFIYLISLPLGWPHKTHDFIVSFSSVPPHHQTHSSDPFFQTVHQTHDFIISFSSVPIAIITVSLRLNLAIYTALVLKLSLKSVCSDLKYLATLVKSPVTIEILLLFKVPVCRTKSDHCNLVAAIVERATMESATGVFYACQPISR